MDDKCPKCGKVLSHEAERDFYYCGHQECSEYLKVAQKSQKTMKEEILDVIAGTERALIAQLQARIKELESKQVAGQDKLMFDAMQRQTGDQIMKLVKASKDARDFLLITETAVSGSPSFEALDRIASEMKRLSDQLSKAIGPFQIPPITRNTDRPNEETPL